jgi:hypothetical protein
MMVLGKENNMERNEAMAFIIGVVLVVITAIVCGTYYGLKKDEAMKSNIESAIVKGIDPLAVRCAYESSSTTCIVYAATHSRGLEAKK